MIRPHLSLRTLAAGLVGLALIGLCLPQTAVGKGDRREKHVAKQAAKRAAKRAKEKSAAPVARDMAPRDTEPRETEPRTELGVARASDAREIIELGEGSERYWVAFASERISIWAERMPADKLLEELEAYGGPSFTSFAPLTRPVTLALVDVRMEDVLRLMLQSYNFAYYYEDGRLAHVRILSFIPGRTYKVSSAIVARNDWTDDVLSRSTD